MPRVSLVMTTTDRQALLPAAIRSVLAMRFDDYELIVSDNFSQPSTEPIVASFADPRIRYLRTDRRLHLTDHWEFVWRHVRGDFVMYLGDDNALHPDILAFAVAASEAHDLDLVAWRVCTYFHPGWDIAYGTLPRRGNILTFEPGTTGGLYRGDPARILRAYADELRMPACFPNMLNCLYRREHAQRLRDAVGQLFWPLAPDVGISCILLGTIRPDGLGFLDAYGAIGGRSRDSNFAAFLSRGKNSQRVRDLMNEYRGTDYLPHHPVKFRSMSNILAATLSQASALLPRQFEAYRYAPRTLALRTIDDLYTLEINPWADDPTLLGEVEAFLQSLPPELRAEALAYREACIRGRAGTAAAAAGAADGAAAAQARRLWTVGPTYHVDLAGFGGRDIADAAHALPRILDLLDRDGSGFLAHNRASGCLGDALATARPWQVHAAA
jgi:glycosyltransferase involved in cell wall biosynthesis